MKKSVLIIYGPVTKDALPDEQENLLTSQEILRIVESDNIKASLLEFNPNIDEFIKAVRKLAPDLVINMVESIYNNPKLMILATLFLEHLKIPFTGSSSETLLITSNKILSKKILQQNGINTPGWISLNTPSANLKTKQCRWIIKPLYEDASIDIEDASVTAPLCGDRVYSLLRFKKNKLYFAEEFIDGREFNVSMFKDGDNLLILPVAEIKFDNYPANKPKILNYKSKWEEDSFEYKNTNRSFNTMLEPKTIELIRGVCTKVWGIFNLEGYARIDFRLDQKNIPYVLEINANPCIAQDSGFAAAALEHGLDYNSLIKRITLC